MKIIENDQIDYEKEFYEIANGNLIDVVKRYQEELAYGSIQICSGRRNEKFVCITLEDSSEFKVYEPLSYKPHISGSDYSANYNNIEDAYYDFLCRVIGSSVLDNLDKPKIVSVINGVNIIYEDDYLILSDTKCKECGKYLKYGEIIDCYEYCDNCRNNKL